MAARIVVCQESKVPFIRPSEYTPPRGSTFPGADWEKVKSPEAAGYSSARLEVLRAWLKTQNTTGMLAVTGGRVLFEYGNIAEISKIASVRKSVLGMLFGNYVARDPKVLHASVKDLGLSDLERDPGEERASLQDLLMSRSGIYFEQADRDAPRKGSQAPGALFHYNNWDFNAAGTAFEKLSGKNIYDALESDLARPIGMQDFDRSKQKKIPVLPAKLMSVHPEYAMYLSTRDMARLGLLMARQGLWNQTYVMPKNWAEYLTTLYTPSAELWPLALRREFSYGPSRWGYGAMWWVWDAPIGTSSANWSHFTGSYTAFGTDGQYITVIPAFDLVVAHKNANIDQTPDRNVSMFDYQTILQMLIAGRCDGPCR
ncbi:MAG: serine hydrolase [Acidobacteria bacterium]|nr:serine hydrolase [Acidobacteriota bacterium]